MSEKPNEPIAGGTPEENNTASESEQIPAFEEREKSKKEPRGISVFTFVLSTVSLVLAAVMITYTVSSALFRKEYVDSQVGQAQTGGAQYSDKYYPFELVSLFLKTYSFEDADEDAMLKAALKSYVAESGDRYAFNYTADEYSEHIADNSGESQGVGINIIYSVAPINGESCDVIKIINVNEGSPADKFGLKVGDLIYGIGTVEDHKSVSELGYDGAFAALRGSVGTEACFLVLRPDGDRYEVIECKIIREKIESKSVYHRVHSEDKNVGIIKILQFDLTTPRNFRNAMDDLIAKGCTEFVFDVRYNLGGDLASIEAILSYFLKENDVIIRTLYKDNREEISKVSVRKYAGEYSNCNVSKEDIGRYRDGKFKFAVLCNENTASAAELFTATFRDYGIGTVVGTTTYGKGSMQKIFPLAPYGYNGALKLTIAKYFSGANGGYNEGYDGVGIEPHIYCEQPDELANKNIYEITDSEDVQLKKALEALNK